MKQVGLPLVLIAVLVLLQTSLIAPLFQAFPGTNMLLMAVVAAIIVIGFSRTWRWVVVAGFMLDLFTYVPIGSNVVSFIIVAYLVSFLSRRVLLGGSWISFIVPIVVVPVATILDRLLFALMQSSTFYQSEFWYQAMLVGSACNLVLFYGIFFLIKRGRRYFSPPVYTLGVR